MSTRPAFRGLIWLLVLLLTWPAPLFAQPTPPSEGPPPPPPQTYTYTQEQLDQMLAPIALYPDTLLSQILMASTYPLEVVEADRWLKQNPGLTGDRLDQALNDKPWDVSVKSLCHYPQVLSMMDDKLQVTTDLGNAFLSQQAQVMDTIQKLRARAQTQGNLQTTEQQKVIVQDRDIIIEPAYPDVVYVPAYDPCWVYGPWWYPACSPLWFWYPGLVIGVGFFWWPRIFIGPIDFWCGFFWHRHSIFVNINKTVFINRIGVTRMHGGVETWTHDPFHRRGVVYRDNATARRFGQTGPPGAEARHAFRGFEPGGRGAQRIGPEQTRPQGVERPGVQPRPAPSGAATGSRTFAQPRGGFGSSTPAQPGGGSAFQGFGRSGIESHQQSERGHQSMGASSRGGGFGGGAPGHTGGFGASGGHGGGFGGGHGGGHR